jgi:hypothetical protein
MATLPLGDFPGTTAHELPRVLTEFLEPMGLFLMDVQVHHWRYHNARATAAYIM